MGHHSGKGQHTFIHLTFDTFYTILEGRSNIFSFTVLPHTVSFQLYNIKVYLVFEAEVTATCLQQQMNNVCVSMFAGAHQGRGALVVLGIYIRAAA